MALILSRDSLPESKSIFQNSLTIALRPDLYLYIFESFFIPSLSNAQQPASHYLRSILLPAKLTCGRVALSPGHCCILVLSVQAVHASARALTSNYFYSNYFSSCIAPSPLYLHTHKHTLTFGAPQAATDRGGSG